MNDQSTCMGCLIQSDFAKPKDSLIPPCCGDNSFGHYGGLSFEEQQILHKLVEAWNEFEALSNHLQSDKKEFLDAIHRCQQIIALRVARRVDPFIWRQSDES